MNNFCVANSTLLFKSLRAFSDRPIRVGQCKGPKDCPCRSLVRYRITNIESPVAAGVVDPEAETKAGLGEAGVPQVVVNRVIAAKTIRREGGR